MIPDLGPVRMRRLLDAFGSPKAILEANGADLRAVKGVPSGVADAIRSWEQEVDLDGELARIAAFGATIITQADPRFPALLREIYDPPLLLYTWGELQEGDQQAISIVGSRKTTYYGTETTKKLSYQLAYAGLTVVSGLARGIDTAAHQGALAAKGRTVAVIGSGLMRLYPQENNVLAERIAGGHGAVVSEFPMLTSPSVQTFPRRNRIVSGWSSGLLVIEAGLKSGALITAGQAADQGRTLFAVPGQIDRSTSAGSNQLIKQGARLVTSAADILEELQLLAPRQLELQPSPGRVLSFSPSERAVYDAILEKETSLETIIAKSNLPPASVSSTLLALEMKQLVKQLPGQHFIKLL